MIFPEKCNEGPYLQQMHYKIFDTQTYHKMLYRKKFLMKSDQEIEKRVTICKSRSHLKKEHTESFCRKMETSSEGRKRRYYPMKGLQCVWMDGLMVQGSWVSQILTDIKCNLGQDFSGGSSLVV